MRKRQTFLLTILSGESDSSSFCGRVKVISSGKSSTFSSLEELHQLIAAEMEEEEQPGATEPSFPFQPSQKPVSAA